MFRFSGLAFTRGVERIAIEGRRVRIYSLAKTIADLFKYRHKVGLDVAVEALRESIRSRKVKPGQIDPFASPSLQRNELDPVQHLSRLYRLAKELEIADAVANVGAELPRE
jgi:hypothetical protein